MKEVKKIEKDVKQPKTLHRHELEEPTEREDDLFCRKQVKHVLHPWRSALPQQLLTFHSQTKTSLRWVIMWHPPRERHFWDVFRRSASTWSVKCSLMFGVWEEHSSVDKTSVHKDLCRWLKQFPTTQKTHSSLHCKTKSSLEVPVEATTPFTLFFLSSSLLQSLI